MTFTDLLDRAYEVTVRPIIPYPPDVVEAARKQGRSLAHDPSWRGHAWEAIWNDVPTPITREELDQLLAAGATWRDNPDLEPVDTSGS